MTDHAAGWTEGLVVAMAIAPGVFSRNRHFDLFRRHDVARARRRAVALRGIARQLVTLALTDLVLTPTGSGGVELFFRAESISLRRTCRLSRSELAVVRTLAARSLHAPLAPSDDDDDIVAAMLARLPPALAGATLDSSSGNDGAPTSGEAGVSPEAS